MSHTGIDIGALTVKMVVVRGDARRGKAAAHQGRPLQVLDELLAEAEFADAEHFGVSGQLGPTHRRRTRPRRQAEDAPALRSGYLPRVCYSL